MKCRTTLKSCKSNKEKVLLHIVILLAYQSMKLYRGTQSKSIQSLKIHAKKRKLLLGLLQTHVRWTVILWPKISKLCVVTISYVSYTLGRKKKVQEKKHSRDYSGHWQWLNANDNLLLDTLTSSDTLNTPDFTKLSSRYTAKDHSTIISIMRRLINNCS